MDSLAFIIYLNISRSYFGGEIPHQLGILSTLHVLDLHDYSNFQSKSIKWLKNLKGLQYLDMSGIDLVKASDCFPVISSLTSLLELHFSRCGLNWLPSNLTTVKPGTHDGFHSMPSLRTLRVAGNTFVNSLSFLNGILSSLSNLHFLDFSYCHISSPVLVHLQNLSLIEYLDLSNNQILKEIPKSLSNLCNFTTLNLHDVGAS
ncbi:hypothetical protein L1987_15503 [Smallanthus sonchifolius]|uniref:Uncharacterized protein n=1 Tax=Smallanthus sonchifolius TaxID=185202 RepID=A0ACB9J7Z2_9ASTR|nr:hypothetical protein L1987_15503 [Smallanthus sonchifolius]